ncbi:11606_t:CDS:10 [Paraglomus brasilianum]|uniref:RNA helicase n=1 Tax=Paraglomus brasilianum TaxID=144538 RepID=A0A9N9DAE6_9GLOM|nr:11606_t:CDS:10 [Paraglomus brasilianum]
MNNNKPNKPFTFGFSQSSSNKSTKSVFDTGDSPRHKLPPLDQSSEDELQPKKRKLVKLDDDEPLESSKTESRSTAGEREYKEHEFVGDLEDDRPAQPTTSTGIRGFVPQGYSGSRGVEKPVSTKLTAPKPTAPRENEDEEEDDPLDAFMLDIDNQVKKESMEDSQKEKIRRDDIEDEDYVESYVKHMKKRGIEIGKSQKQTIERDENVDSDEEVYATARAIDAQLEYDSDDNLIVEPKRKDIEPLSAVDHSQIEYPEIEKYFYEEHPEIAAMSEEKLRQIRKDLDMHVSGVDVAKPCIAFAHFGFDEALVDNIVKHGYSEPTAIQKQAVPVALSGRDIIGIAKTGSGKTAAFIWPMLIHIMDQPELQSGEGPIGLILAPTRELAGQIYTEAKKFAKCYGLRVAAVYGGASKMDQFKELRPGGIEILVGTPGRLIDMVKMKATNFRRVSFLVLDEADRMFDLGFEPQVRSICDNIRPDRQTLLFSATFPKKVERLAREVTTAPIRISIGNVGQANTDITQVIEIVPDDGYKWGWLMAHLVSLCLEGSVLIFVSRKGGVDELSMNIKENGYKCGALHGDMLQYERDKVLREYKNNEFPILVATDVAARGLDIKSVKTVVNYDIARDIDSHVHRIGRTGRAGEKGTAYTLITQKEDSFAAQLVRNLETSGQTVPDKLLELAMRNSKFRKSRQMIRGGGRGRGNRGKGKRGRDFGGRGGIGATGANAIPRGNTTRLPTQIPPPPPSQSSESSYSSHGNVSSTQSRYQISFQKATAAEPALGSLHTGSQSGQSGQNAGSSSSVKKRRWDS